MTIYYVQVENDLEPSESMLVQVPADDPLDASLKATAKAKRERLWSSCSSRAVSTTKPKIEKAQPKPRTLRASKAKPVQGSLGV